MSTPRCCLIGDSISLGYGDQLAAAMLGKVDYFRKDGMAEAIADLDNPRGSNGGDSSMVLEFLQEQIALDPKPSYDLFLLNCGLHDIKTCKKTDAVVISKDAYRQNLQAILAVIPQLAPRFIWINTTPVDDDKHAARTFGYHRYNQDVMDYNAIAAEVMHAAGVQIIDLHGFTQHCATVSEDSIFRDGVHFHQPVIREQALWLAGYILGALGL